MTSYLDHGTIDDAATSVRAVDLRRDPHLFCVFECDRPEAGGARWSLRGINQVIIGRGARREAVRDVQDGFATLRISIPARAMSSVHARLLPVSGGWVIEDARSRNGTFLNGARIERAAVGEGDLLELGRTLFTTRPAIATEAASADVDVDGAPPLARGLSTLLPELAMRYGDLARIARSTVPLLLLGETGTGKEVLARAVHTLSGRAGRFVAVNCGALPANLVEGQLFGHVRGAFSGAVRDEPGLVRAADGGTLLLDEIGDLPASSQAALLRVLQEGEVLPVGSTRTVQVDLRIVAATHRPLANDVAAGRFRDDLLARLSGFRMQLSPLRQRREDLGLLVAEILRSIAPDRLGRVTLSPSVARAFLSHGWPHNVRELQQALSAALVLATDGAIASEHLPEEIVRPGGLRESTAPPLWAPVTEPPRDDEGDRLRHALIASLRAHQGNVAAVARAMGKAPMQIHRWMKRFAIDPNEFR
jgi:DNA-binding NtrC family response regulator